MIARLLGVGFLSFLLLCLVSQQVRDWAVGGMRMAELKPCPFCGGEARFTCWINPYKDRYGVACLSDDCNVSIFAGLSKEEAARRWNRRVGDGT